MQPLTLDSSQDVWVKTVSFQSHESEIVDSVLPVLVMERNETNRMTAGTILESSDSFLQE